MKIEEIIKEHGDFMWSTSSVRNALFSLTQSVREQTREEDIKFIEDKFRDKLEIIATKGTLTPCGETTLKILEEICIDIVAALRQNHEEHK